MIKFLSFIFLLSFTSSIAYSYTSEQAKDLCLKTSRYVLFTKGLLSIDNKYENHINEQYSQGLYSDFELEKLRKEKVAQIPNSICNDEISMSISEFINLIKYNCIKQESVDEIKTYTREIASDLSETRVKNTYESLNRVRKTALKDLENSLSSFTKCNKKSGYTSDISAINLNVHSTMVCKQIIYIINQARADRSKCL